MILSSIHWVKIFEYIIVLSNYQYEYFLIWKCIIHFDYWHLIMCKIYLLNGLMEWCISWWISIIPFSLHLGQKNFQNGQIWFQNGQKWLSKWPKKFSKWPKITFKMAKNNFQNDQDEIHINKNKILIYFLIFNSCAW